MQLKPVSMQDKIVNASNWILFELTLLGLDYMSKDLAFLHFNEICIKDLGFIHKLTSLIHAIIM